VTTGSRARVRELLRQWTAAAEALTAGFQYAHARTASGDPGEAAGLGPARLTLTFGFGPGLFETSGRSRFGLGAAKPRALAPLPPFAGEQLDRAQSGGELCVQACADDPQVTFHAIHVLAGLVGTDASLRWIQQGFRAQPLEHGETSRNLIGFKDGTNNVNTADAAAMGCFVWARSPGWMRAGTYLVARRIQIVFAGWDGLDLTQQERAIGRYKSSGAPLGASREHDTANLAATDARGNPVIPIEAHIRVAGPENNRGQQILRRGYSFSSGVTPGTLRHGGHQVDGGLFFIAMVREPRRQIIPILEKVSARDALSTFTVHTASAIFACPSGCRSGGYIGEQLLA
jgi:deferrochelatase/peroxidase EfeB